MRSLRLKGGWFEALLFYRIRGKSWRSPPCRSSFSVKTPAVYHMSIRRFYFLAFSEDGQEIEGLQQAAELPWAVEGDAVLLQGIDEEAQFLPGGDAAYDIYTCL